MYVCHSAFEKEIEAFLVLDGFGVTAEKEKKLRKSLKDEKKKMMMMMMMMSVVGAVGFAVVVAVEVVRWKVRLKVMMKKKVVLVVLVVPSVLAVPSVKKRKEGRVVSYVG